MDQSNEDKAWEELKNYLSPDIIEKFQRLGKYAYPHQFEFIKYTLGQPIKNQAPLLTLRSQTGSGKTLCFQSLIYQRYSEEYAKNFSQMKEIKRKDGSRVQKNVLYPYTVILGNTIFLKQHEETIMGILVGLYILLIELMPERLKQQGLSCQTFFALTKDQQFHIQDNKIEEAKSNVFLCHPSKLFTGIKLGIINFRNLRQLVVDEADQLLEKKEENRARIETLKIISYLLGQNVNEEYQLIFVSATLKKEEIEEIMTDAIQMNFEEDKKIDSRFLKIDNDLKVPQITIQNIPQNYISQIAPYTITHLYIEPEQPKQKKNILSNLIHKVFDNYGEIQVMVFFNTKVATSKIKQEVMKHPDLKFIVEKDLIVECTGNKFVKMLGKIRRRYYFVQVSLQYYQIFFNNFIDVLQRGLDFRKVRLIIHYGLPHDSAKQFLADNYFQRSGRTGRAKDEGAVVTILSQKDRTQRKDQFIKELEKTGSKVAKYNEETFIKDVETSLNFNQET